MRLYYTEAEVAGLVESSLRMYWWDDATWFECSHTGVNVDENHIWAKIRTDTTPSLNDLVGTPFGAAGRPPVGGVIILVDRLALLLPYIAMLVAVTATAIGLTAALKKRMLF